MVLVAKFWSAKGSEIERFRDVVEKREGDEASSHLTSDSHKALGVGALVERPHGHRHGRVDVLSATDVVGQHDTDRMDRPGNGDIVLSDPLSCRKGEDDHQQSANEFLDVGLPVFFVFNATCCNTKD